MLKDKILDLLNRSDFMTLSTSVAGNSSAEMFILQTMD